MDSIANMGRGASPVNWGFFPIISCNHLSIIQFGKFDNYPIINILFS